MSMTGRVVTLILAPRMTWKGIFSPSFLQSSTEILHLCVGHDMILEKESRRHCLSRETLRVFFVLLRDWCFSSLLSLLLSLGAFVQSNRIFPSHHVFSHLWLLQEKSSPATDLCNKNVAKFFRFLHESSCSSVFSEFLSGSSFSCVQACVLWPSLASLSCSLLCEEEPGSVTWVPLWVVSFFLVLLHAPYLSSLLQDLLSWKKSLSDHDLCICSFDDDVLFDLLSLSFCTAIAVITHLAWCRNRWILSFNDKISRRLLPHCLSWTSRFMSEVYQRWEKRAKRETCQSREKKLCKNWGEERVKLLLMLHHLISHPHDIIPHHHRSHHPEEYVSFPASPLLYRKATPQREVESE